MDLRSLWQRTPQQSQLAASPEKPRRRQGTSVSRLPEMVHDETLPSVSSGPAHLSQTLQVQDLRHVLQSDFQPEETREGPFRQDVLQVPSLRKGIQVHQLAAVSRGNTHRPDVHLREVRGAVPQQMGNEAPPVSAR